MVESFIRDVYKSEKIGISLAKDTLSVRDQYYRTTINRYKVEPFFDNFKYVRVKGPITFIECAENKLYKKINGMLGLAKDAMKRKG